MHAPGRSSKWPAAVALAGLAAASAVVAAPGLEGRYGLMAMGACLSSSAGFLPNNVAIEPSAANSTVNRGVLTFRHDGTGSARIVQTQLNLPPAAPVSFSSSADVSFDFTYRLGPDGAMTLDMLLDTYAATFRSGPRAGQGVTFVTTPPLAPTWVWSGTYSEDRKTLLLSSGDTLSKVRFSSGTEAYLICQFERVLTRLTP